MLLYLPNMHKVLSSSPELKKKAEGTAADLSSKVLQISKIRNIYKNEHLMYTSVRRKFSE